MSYFVGGIGQDYIPNLSQLNFLEQQLQQEQIKEEENSPYIQSSFTQSGLEGSNFYNNINAFGTVSVGIDSYDRLFNNLSNTKIKGTSQSNKSNINLSILEKDVCSYVPPYFNDRLVRQMKRGGGQLKKVKEDYINFPNFQSRRIPSISPECKYKDSWHDEPAELTGEKLHLYFP